MADKYELKKLLFPDPGHKLCSTIGCFKDAHYLGRVLFERIGKEMKKDLGLCKLHAEEFAKRNGIRWKNSA